MKRDGLSCDHQVGHGHERRHAFAPRAPAAHVLQPFAALNEREGRDEDVLAQFLLQQFGLVAVDAVQVDLLQRAQPLHARPDLLPRGTLERAQVVECLAADSLLRLSPRLQLILTDVRERCAVIVDEPQIQIGRQRP